MHYSDGAETLLNTENKTKTHSTRETGNLSSSFTFCDVEKFSFSFVLILVCNSVFLLMPSNFQQKTRMISVIPSLRKAENMFDPKIFAD